MNQDQVLIVGAGLAGLNCGINLQRQGIPALILEASDQVGGRVRTDQVDGFLCDRGFQILLTEYPEAQLALDYPSLQLKPFEAGALVRFQGKFHPFVDPFRQPGQWWQALTSPVASLMDKWRILKLRRQVSRGTVDDLLEQPEITTLQRIHSFHFTPQFIERFFKPFLGGVFLEPNLETSSRLFDFLFRKFCNRKAVLPAEGMGQIPQQLASQFTEHSLRLNTKVLKVEKNQVQLESGERLQGRAVVLATEHSDARAIIGENNEPAQKSNSVCCLYFAADQPPISQPILVLNGEPNGPINNLCVPSQVAPGYAPPGQSLVSVTTLELDPDPENLLRNVKRQLQDWFGEQVAGWRHLKTYSIPAATPRQTPGLLEPVQKTPRNPNGVFLAGDYRNLASIQGALASGRQVAAAIAGNPE
ncbi:MAG: NAD(P)/FAD-dependent oxidoreductase [Planctomycetota bacterium]|nr:NAD(P)/FAD-dependent oxidoreductase [Planctomycetota bacterium]